MTITHTFIKAFDSRPLIVFISSPFVEITEKFAEKLHDLLGTSDNVIFYDYSELLKSAWFLNLIPDFLFKEIYANSFYKDSGASLKGFFTSWVREAICKDVKLTVHNNFNERGRTPEKIIFVGHGLGSLVVWDYLRNYKPPVHITKAIFLGSPLYLSIPWALVERDVSPYEGITTSFLGTRDSICAYGKVKRGLGVERAVQGSTHNLYSYLTYASKVNKMFGDFWSLEEDA